MNASSPHPESRSPRPVPHLPPEEAFPAALQTALQALLAYAQAQAERMLHGRNPHPLHDFRAALRALRSVLSAFKPLLPPTARSALCRTLRRLVQDTGSLRDLDALLEAECDRSPQGTPEPQPLRPLLDLLESRRNAERKRIQRRFQSSAFQRTLATACRRAIALQPQPTFRTLPLRGAISCALPRRHAKLVRLARRCARNPTPGAVHALRIEVKKLRYLVEVFQHALPPAHVRPLLRSLKASQRSLGEVHDLSRRPAILRQALQETQRAESGAASLAAARLWRKSLRRERRHAENRARRCAKALLHSRFSQRLQHLVQACGLPDGNGTL